jgi:hypothetical protein
MLPATLNIIENPSLDVGTRQAAAIYLKNRVQQAWDERDSKTAVAHISDADKALIKQRMLAAMTSSHQPVKLQLKAAVGK